MIAFSALLFIALFAAERVKPAQALNSVAHWRGRVALLATVELTLYLLVTLSTRNWLDITPLIDLPFYMGDIASGFAAYFVATFVFYWWHRIRHTNDFLWRVFHQLHHAPTRIELATTFYKHPAEVLANLLISAVLLYPLFGLSLEGAAIYNSCIIAAQFIVHVNVRTPRWMGYFIQRPEMHRVHHEAETHRNNYGDLPIWDMLFGTFENPRLFDGRCGFDPHREVQLGTMLRMQDVHHQ